MMGCSRSLLVLLASLASSLICVTAQEWSPHQFGSFVCPPNEIFYSPCRPCDNLCDEGNEANLNETCNQHTPCIAGCACAAGLYRTSDGACVNAFMCSISAANQTSTSSSTTTTNAIDEEKRITKKRCYEGYCKKDEFCIDAGIGAVCLSSTLTTTTTTTSTSTTEETPVVEEGDLSTQSAASAATAARESNSKCQNMKCAHGGMCFEILGEARCFTSPLCRNVLERWYDSMPCESECSNRTIIHKTCSQERPAGCACRPTFIRDEDGSCTLPVVCLNAFKPLPVINLEPLVVVDMKLDRDRKINSLPSSSSSSSSEDQDDEEGGERPYE